MTSPDREAGGWWARRRLLAVGCCVVGLAVPAVATAQDATPQPTPQATVQPTSGPSPTSSTDLAPFDLVMALHEDTFDSADVGLVVTDAEGTVVLDRRAGTPLLPASTMKVLTAAAVLDTMGPHRRITTRVTTTTPPDDGGVVPNLVLVGAGDPALTTDAYRTHIFRARPATSIEALADRVVAAGVTRVTGSVVGDGTAFGPLEQAAGWPQRYLADRDAHRISALSIDTGVEVDTFPIGGFERLIGQRQAEFPPLHAAWEFTQALRERGVEVDGRVLMAGVPTAADHQVAWVSSPPADELVRFMLERSDNHMADTLLRTAGLRVEGVGSWSAGGRAVATALEDLGVDTTGLVVDDGSGLSRLDRVSPATLAGADRVLTDRFGGAWSSWLSTVGVDGTLDARLVGTEAEGRYHGKSGSLSDVKARVGHVRGDAGARLHMAVIANQVTRGQAWRVTVLADDLTVAMVDHLEGCRRVPRLVEPAPNATGPAATSQASPAPATPQVTASPAPTLPTAPLSDASAWRRVCAAS